MEAGSLCRVVSQTPEAGNTKGFFWTYRERLTPNML